MIRSVPAEAVPLDLVARGLRDAGLGVLFRPAPDDQAWPYRGPALWVPVPGTETWVVVASMAVRPGTSPGGWAYAGAGAAGSTPGFGAVITEVGPGDRAFARDQRYAVGAADTVRAVKELAGWERDATVIPVIEPDATRARRLSQIAQARLSGSHISVAVDIDPLMIPLLDADHAALLDERVRHLHLPGIRWRFPREGRAPRLERKARVLLEELAPPPHANGRGVWLVADGPGPVSDGITIRLATVVGKGWKIRWDSFPEYWRDDLARPRSLRQLWGTAGSGELAGTATDLLLAGRTEDALRLCGVEMDAAVVKLLGGRPVSLIDRGLTGKWSANANAIVTRSAPWTWAYAAAVSEQPVSKGQPKPRRLEGLKGLNVSRLPGLFLDRRDGDPFLSFAESASPLVVPRPLWERDVDYDLVRAGLLRADEIPLPRPS